VLHGDRSDIADMLVFVKKPEEALQVEDVRVDGAPREPEEAELLLELAKGEGKGKWSVISCQFSV